jgi:hypothetical protein
LLGLWLELWREKRHKRRLKAPNSYSRFPSGMTARKAKSKDKSKGKEPILIMRLLREILRKPRARAVHEFGPTSQNRDGARGIILESLSADSAGR